MMKVAIVSLFSRFGGVTGDCVQAQKTFEALLAFGVDVSRRFIGNDGIVYNEQGQVLGNWCDVFSQTNIIHAIPPIPSHIINRFPKIDLKFAVSPIFWRSFRYNRVVAKNQKIAMGVFKELIRDCMAVFNLKGYRVYKGYDLILPNSEDELNCFSRYCWMKKTALLRIVPNAIDPIPSWVVSLERPDFLPKGDYIVCPAFFAARKNQKMLVEVFRDTDYTIVFMGGGDSSMSRKCATDNMRFLGHIPHGSKEFYQTLMFARVACLPSNCETPGIALLESASLGARPVVSFEGGTAQYYGWDAEYFDPLKKETLHSAVVWAWERGRLTEMERNQYKNLTWAKTAACTVNAYKCVLDAKRQQV